MIFGQGAIAAHPYLRAEMSAIAEDDKQEFHTLIWQHIGYFAKNFAKSLCSSWTGGWFINTPESSLKNEYRKLTRLSHNYAWLADLSLIYLGGKLKRKERISARLADGMAYLYMASAALHFAKDIEKNDDAHVHATWAANYCFAKAQQAMIDLCANYPAKILGKLVGFLINPFGQTMRFADDKLDARLASMMMKNNEYRNLLKQSLYMPDDPKQPLGRVEYAHQLIQKHQSLYQKIGKFKRYKLQDIEKLLQDYVKDGKLSADELQTIMEVERARREAILVDEFTHSEIQSKTYKAWNSPS